MNQRRKEEKEWELACTFIALVLLACLWEAVGAWYR